MGRFAGFVLTMARRSSAFSHTPIANVGWRRPCGYYAASVGGEELIGWHVNRGPEQAADFFPASRFRDRFYRPDVVVAHILETLDEGGAVAEADAAARRKPDTTALVKILPPVVTVLEPANEAEVREVSVPFRVTVRSPSGEAITAVRAYIDGRPSGKLVGSSLRKIHNQQILRRIVFTPLRSLFHPATAQSLSLRKPDFPQVRLCQSSCSGVLLVCSGEAEALCSCHRSWCLR